METRDLVALIPDWLAVTRGQNVSAGLSRQEALRRAAVLRGLLREGQVRPEEVVIEEDLKDVFHGLVAFVTEIEPLAGGALADEANAAYQFLARVEWEGDDFGEKRDLLVALASAGWRALGMSLEEVSNRRSGGEFTDGVIPTIQEYMVDPSVTLAEDAERRVERLMQLEAADLNDDALSVLGDGEVLSALCKRLRQNWNSEPAGVASRATVAYRWLVGSGRKCGLFDEHDYFVGELGLLAAGAYRLIGDRENAEQWLHRAESGFRHTVNPEPMLAQIAYTRLALAYDRRRYEDVLELLPSTARRFERLGMAHELAKTWFLRAMTLKECGRKAEALDAFKALDLSLTDSALDLALLGSVCTELGALQAADGSWEIAAGSYRRAISLVVNSGNSAALAHLRMTLGGTLRNQDRFDEAAVAFREGIGAYASLGMATSVAYVRVVLAETLLHLNRPREAEWEILQALPTIEEQKMVPEGFAAVALLRESVKRRKTDPNALRELREHLQQQK